MAKKLNCKELNKLKILFLLLIKINTIEMLDEVVIIVFAPFGSLTEPFTKTFFYIVILKF